MLTQKVVFLTTNIRRSPYKTHILLRTHRKISLKAFANIELIMLVHMQHIVIGVATFHTKFIQSPAGLVGFLPGQSVMADWLVPSSGNLDDAFRR